MSSPVFISADFIQKNTDFNELIEKLKKAFLSNKIISPARHHHDFPNSKAEEDSTMLLMPSWQDSTDAGVKIVTVNPQNSRWALPSIQGTYIYLDSSNGNLKANIEAKKLTNKRTAAASALASMYLSRKDSTTLVMVGTGALSRDLIRAHCAVRPINEVLVWGRDKSKARMVCNELENEVENIRSVDQIREGITQADIISAATLSPDPLIKGEWLKKGQHVDLVGSFKPHMREADDECIKISSVFADVKEMAVKECGDLKIPLESGIINLDSIHGDLFDLCQKNVPGRRSEVEITLFKSVGHALEDLVAARYYYEKYVNVKGL